MRIPNIYGCLIILSLLATAGAAQARTKTDAHHSVVRGGPSPMQKKVMGGVRDLVRNLAKRHVRVKLGGKVTQPFFSVRGQILKLKDVEIQAFEYRSVQTARKEGEAAGGDCTNVGTTSISWIAPPHFFRSGKLIVLYVGDQQSVLRLLEDVLGSQIAGR